MNITVLQENIISVIQDVQKSIATKPALPVLACLHIEALVSGEIIFSATDLNVGIRSKIQGEVTEPGVVVVPAKVLIDYVNTLGPGSIEFTLDQSSLKIKSADSTATIQCFTASDYPVFPRQEGVEFTLLTEMFAPAVQATTFAASVDEARPVLTSLLLKFSDQQLDVVATDGFRLTTLSLPFGTPQAQELLIPAKALNEVFRITAKKKVENVVFTVSEKLKQVFFSFANVEMLVRLMDGEFPPYQKIIPAEFQTQAVWDGNEFAQKMKTALIFARESSGVVRFFIEKDQLKITSSSSSYGQQETRMPIKVLQGGDQEIAFNAKYVMDFLNTVKPESIWFGMNESLKPALLRPDNMPEYRYIIMPFRVNE